MVTRPPAAYLADVRAFAEDIDRFLSGRTLNDFVEDSMLRAAVERKLQNIGEALVQLSRVSAALAQQVPRHRELIGMRNVLVHGYSGLNTEELWEAIRQNLPSLLEAAQRIAPSGDHSNT
jgi:uncharacterized protein with HEPN domain